MPGKCLDEPGNFNRTCGFMGLCRQHAQNRTKSTSRNYTSSYYHVHWDAHKGMWRSEVETSRGGTRQRQVSYHDDEIEAAKASDLAAKRLHKAFASLNFP